MRKIILTGFVLILGVGVLAWADSSNSSAPSNDQTENSYYWQGTQLYNLGRLGEAFDSFEKAVQKNQNSKEAQAYLLQIRQEIVNNAKKRADAQASMNFNGNSPESALSVVNFEKGYTKVTLQAKYLFDENTASLKLGAVDVLNRLADLLQNKEGSRVEITMADDLDDTSKVKDIDAERTLMIFSYLNFKRLSMNAANQS